MEADLKSAQAGRVEAKDTIGKAEALRSREEAELHSNTKYISQIVRNAIRK
jgi:hypothetical protein